MSREDREAGTRHGVVHAAITIGRGRGELRARGVESDVKDLVVVASEGVDTSAALHVPYLASAVNRTTDAKIGRVVELAR